MAATVAFERFDKRTVGVALPYSSKKLQLPDFSRVFRGNELTRKDRRLPSRLSPLDSLIDGGIARGRLSEILGRAGSGRTTLAASFAASATWRGEVVAWIDATGAFDPASVAAAGVELRRVLWVSLVKCMQRGVSRKILRPHCNELDQREQPSTNISLHVQPPVWKAAELVLKAGGFGLVVIDFGDAARSITQSAALRLARAAERCDAAVLVLATRRLCGTFSALSLSLTGCRARFSRTARGAPVLFDGYALEVQVARNKLGPMGQRTVVHALMDPVLSPSFEAQLNASAPWSGKGKRAHNRAPLRESGNRARA